MPPSRRHRTAVAPRWALALAWLAVLALLAPLLVMGLGALHVPGAPPPRGAELLRLPPETGAAFARAVALVPLGRALLTSTLLGLLAIPPVLLTASGAGLALALAGRRTRAWLGAGVLLLVMVPPAAVWVPRFLLFKQAGLVGTWAPVLAPALFGGSPLFVLLYAAAFRRLPRELFEAAQLEGVGAVSAWWRFALPQVRATSVAVALLAFSLFFGNFVDALLYLNPESSPTAPMMLRELQLLGGTQWPVLMAGAVLVTAPTLLAFAGAQRTLVSPGGEGA